MIRKIRVATRGSKLSLIQSKIAIECIRRRFPNLEFEVKIIKTTGDAIQDKPLYKIGVKGIFEKEVNIAVLEGKADIAIHSLKDLPGDIHPDLVIAGYPPRDSPLDVLVTTSYEPDLEALPERAIIGTSSLRRRAFILHRRPDLKVENIRGNVDTRIKKLIEGKYDAIVLAEAGIVRLIEEGLKFPIKYRPINPRELPPAPGQGIIAIVTRRDNEELISILEEASDWKTRIEAQAEREFLRKVRGGCHIPLGGVARIINDKLIFIAGIASIDGSEVKIVEFEGDLREPRKVGEEVACRLRVEAKHIFEKIEYEKESVIKS